MKKIIIYSFFLLLFSNQAFPQTKSVKDMYWDYIQIRMSDSKKQETIAKALELLNHKTELNEKQIANLNYHLGRIYESIDEIKAIPYYEECIKFSPNYYVPYLALAAINIKKCNALSAEVNKAGKEKNIPLYKESFTKYKNQVLKTLIYMEKAQACDPDEQMLDMINKYYSSIKDMQALGMLPERLKKLSENCATLLDDE
ncbi:hypothetical protein [Pedobacter punctiformis]|uniref:Tetratricopeptide repeat protein n=1 Tax=Pedobacter punctiformis TaxID=3004097 RepID=A0ABT4LBZ0_9SPHI|nr:hypothetical protein [Pedobacter sp. HCMS5-2]MCZ4245435.1 hypothetical protein [Pedobacter sp. HCMS5-2]